MAIPDISSGSYTTVKTKPSGSEGARLHKTSTADIHSEKGSRPEYSKGTLLFYIQYFWLVLETGIRFLFPCDPCKSVARRTLRFLNIIEQRGARVSIDGLDRFPESGGPYVFASNHMSTLDVNLLPGLIMSRLPLTPIVKSSLYRTPFFGRIVRRLGSISLERNHPGEDLIRVMTQGAMTLSQGKSILVFPEGTRQSVFSPGKFNSLAVKLAIKARVPVVPVAIRSDFLGNGRKVKDLGSLYPDKPVHISFGDPIVPSGRGRKEQQQILGFISQKLADWNAPVHFPDLSSTSPA